MSVIDVYTCYALAGAGSLIGLGLNILIIKLFTDFLGLWYGWGAFVAVGAVALNNFLLNNAWTFTHKTSDMP